MNNERRKRISQVQALLDDALDALEAILLEEQEYYDNMPEGIQCSDKGTVAENNVGYLGEAYQSVSDATNILGNIE